MPKRPDLPVLFTKLVLENIRSFSERQELKLVNDDGRPARWTLIVGDNGVGKTTLLQCLARMRPVFNDTSTTTMTRINLLINLSPSWREKRAMTFWTHWHDRAAT